MAKENNIFSHIHTELALLELQSAIARIRLIAESDISTSEFRECFPAESDELKKATYDLSNLKNASTATPTFLYSLGSMNLYRITVRGKDGRISDHEIEAPSLHLAVQGQDEHSKVVKVERIDASTGEVLGGFYNE
jgi:hypothetical protein